MVMKSTAKAPITENYKHSLEPAQGSPGKSHGAAVFTETLGKITISGSKVVLSPLPFVVIGCSDGIDAVGLGWGSVKAEDRMITRSNSAAVLLDGDKGQCSGYLFSPTRGMLPCNCTMKVEAATAAAGALPIPNPSWKAASSENPLRSGQFRLKGIDGNPVPNVPLRFIARDGQEKLLKTNGAGIVNLNGLTFRAEQVIAGEDPRNWSPYGRPNPLEISSFDLNGFLMTTYGKSQEQFRGLGKEPEKKTLGAVLVVRAEDMLPWLGPAMLGEFNENPTIGQIVFDTVLTLFPYLDQMGDVRDIVAVLIRMSEPGENSEFFNWVTLATCVIGAIPTIGSALRGGYRIFLRDYIKSGSLLGDSAQATIEQMLNAMRALGIGDPRPLLKTSAKELGDKAVAAYRKLVERLETVLKFIVANASATSREFAQRLRKMVPLPHAEQRIRAAVRWLHDQTLSVLDEGLEKRVGTTGFNDASDAWKDGMPGGKSAEKVVKHTRDTIPNSMQKFGKPSLRLTAEEWREATHAILRHALKNRAVEHTFVHKGKTYTIWHGESGLLYGAYEDLDQLSAYFKSVHPKVYGRPANSISTDPMYDTLKDYYTRGEKVLDRRVEGFQHQHVIDQKDMADRYLKPGAKIMPLDGDSDLFVKSSDELKKIYRQLPCVTVARDRHLGHNSLSSLAAKNRQYDDLTQLRLTYSEIYGEILEPAEAREVRSVLKEFVRFVSEAQ